MKTRLLLPVLMILGSLLFGCHVTNYVVDPYAKLSFKVAENVNPDMEDRASPVVVKVFELSSRTLFESQDFFSLYDDAEKVLGPDLITKNEFEFEPGAELVYEITLSPGVRHAGILVAYRDIDNASWREVVDIDPEDHETYDVHIGELAVYVQ